MFRYNIYVDTLYVCFIYYICIYVWIYLLYIDIRYIHIYTTDTAENAGKSANKEARNFSKSQHFRTFRYELSENIPV